MAKPVKVQLDRSLLGTVLRIASEQYREDIRACKENPRLVASFEESLRTVEGLRNDIEETIDLIELTG